MFEFRSLVTPQKALFKNVSKIVKTAAHTSIAYTASTVP